MARMPNSENSDSLFPYLSVLLCIIGVLFLGLVIISTGQLSLKKKITQNQAAWEEFKRIREQRERAQQAAQALEVLRDEEKAKSLELAEIRRQVGSLESVATDAKRREGELALTVQDVAKLDADAQDKRRQLAELTKTRDDRLVALKSAPKPGTVRIIGTARIVGQDGGKTGAPPPKPVFLECRGNNVILLPEGTPVPSTGLETSSVFSERLARAEKDRDKGALVVLLVRTDGVKTFDRANAILRKHDVKYGYLPIPGTGEIDLSAFN
jgi:hypothetical protein